MKPRFTLKIIDNKLGKEMTIGVEVFKDFRKKTLEGKSAVYTVLDSFEEQVLGKASSRSPK